jgi:hypothetical protein
MCRPVYHFFTELELFQKIFVEKIKSTYFKFIFPEKRTVYEITYKNMGMPGRPQMTI